MARLTVPLLLAIMVPIVDYLIRTLALKIPLNLPFSLAIALVVFLTSGAILHATGRIPGAVIFGVITTVFALLLQIVTTEMIAVAIVFAYWTVVGFIVALITPPISKATGTRA